MTTNKPILLIGEAWGQHEERIKAPFCGASGLELLKMLAEAQIITLTSDDFSYINQFWNHNDPRMLDMVWRLHPEVARTNVLNFHPPGNNLEALCGGKKDGIIGYPAITKAKYLPQKYIPELERLGDEITDLDPNLIICLGNTPLWALAGSTGISKLRGTTRLSTHTATGFKLLPTYHPAAVLRQWELRPTAIMDLVKAKREAEYPEVRRPQREIWIEPEIKDLYDFYNQHLEHAEIISVDIETSGNQITCIGFAPNPQFALVVPFLDIRKKNKSYWPSLPIELEAWKFVRMVCESPIPKVGQNIIFDTAFTWRSYGICIRNIQHDDMLLHHALQPESLKGLGFLGSVYGDESSWKADHRSATIKRDA